jgi:hypothetical protein
MKAKATKHKRVRRPRSPESSPVTMLVSELRALHRDLRTIANAYVSRLETDLFVCLAALRAYGPIEQVPREMLHQIRDLTIIVRNRKLKPEKGRRKDLRKIDSLIGDLVATVGQKN